MVANTLNNIARNIARFMGVIEMEIKPCISCGMDCQLEEAISSYLEFDNVDDYVTAFDGDMSDYSMWWMHTLIPMRSEYADIYPLHIDCLPQRNMESEG